MSVRELGRICIIYSCFKELFAACRSEYRVSIDKSSPVFVYARKYIALTYKYVCDDNARISLSAKSLRNVFEFWDCYDNPDFDIVAHPYCRFKYRYLRSNWFCDYEAIKVVEADGYEFVDISRAKRNIFCRVSRTSILFCRRLFRRFLNNSAI